MKRESTSFTPNEIAVLLNNATAVSRRPDSGEIDEVRLRRCRSFTLALIQPLEELVNGGVDEETGRPFQPCLRAEELVCILAAGALYVQQAMILESDKLPQTKISEALFKREL